jgi:hypothetical protein
MMRLIGLHGRAGAGKDTVGAMLVARQTDTVARLAFAQPIRDMLAAGLRDVGITWQLLADRTRKEERIEAIGRSPRELMQTLGTEWGRNLVHTDLWLHIAAIRLAYHRRFATATVITDCRFNNEARWIRAQGGEIWHVLRKYGWNVAPLHPEPLHQSEHGIEMVAGVDSVILNDEGLEQLEFEVRAAWAGERVIEQARA